MNIHELTGTRISWVDYAKAFAILGVFVIHSAAPVRLSAVVSAYDMMVFFFLSGFVFSIRKYVSFMPFLWNKIRTLLVPGLFLAIVPFVIERLIALVNGKRWGGVEYLRWFAGYAINLRGREGFGAIPWFLTCLFVMELGGYVVLRMLDRLQLKKRRCDIALAGITLISLTAGWLYSAYVHIVLPWCCDVALSMFAFFILGVLARPHVQVMHRSLAAWTIVPALLVLLMAVWANGTVFHGSVNPYMNDLGNPVCFVVGALAGIWMILAVCRWIADASALNAALGGVLSYWGRNTLVFYCVNAAIYMQVIPDLLGFVGLDTVTVAASADVGMQLVCALGAVLVNLVVCTPCAEIMNRFLPEMLGKRRK